jgi:hypothetical protein
MLESILQRISAPLRMFFSIVVSVLGNRSRWAWTVMTSSSRSLDLLLRSAVRVRSENVLSASAVHTGHVRRQNGEHGVHGKQRVSCMGNKNWQQLSLETLPPLPGSDGTRQFTLSELCFGLFFWYFWKFDAQLINVFLNRRHKQLPCRRSYVAG